MKSISVFLWFAVLTAVIGAAESPMVTYLDAYRAFRGAQTFKDKDSGLLFYVESDGRHVAAINADGKIVWIRDPFNDAKLPPYRLAHPQIVEIGEPLPWMIEGRKGHFVRVNFNSSQTLILDVASGDPTWMGQD